MHIVVCIKQVPDAKNVRIDPETCTLIRQGVESIVNPHDWYAVEGALRLKDAAAGKVTAITMGPPQAEEALRQVLALGVDEALLLSDRTFAGADTWATSLTLARAIEKLAPVDLVFCGKQAIDGDTAQVGPELAGHLGWPYATYVRKLEMVAAGELQVERLTDLGYEVVEISLPAVLTVVREIGDPRMPGLRHKMRARKQEIPVMGAAELGLQPEQVGLQGSFTQVVRVFSPPPRGDRLVLTGTVEEQAELLLQKLSEEKIPGL
ncbi:MAG: electron transfer flavoprotein subunit beta/FixA family protein [Deltaproteobacteria bacterium]|nr:electron transfer flavoprotein subunit beta/FixA family protein [Deltaproteobacteria bacterium]MBW2071817.1 electron transfer flavoprotein subunit beta/FixA family protein [Deltaproteobacteria bacterium]